jgi:hypothetical protein
MLTCGVSKIHQSHSKARNENYSINKVWLNTADVIAFKIAHRCVTITSSQQIDSYFKYRPTDSTCILQEISQQQDRLKPTSDTKITQCVPINGFHTKDRDGLGSPYSDHATCCTTQRICNSIPGKGISSTKHPSRLWSPWMGGWGSFPGGKAVGGVRLSTHHHRAQ